MQEPRARELIEEATAAAGLTAPAFACLDHLGNGENLDDPSRTGKMVVQCGSTIKKAGTKFVSTRLQSLEKCVDASFVCVQTKKGADQLKCLEEGRRHLREGVRQDSRRREQAPALGRQEVPPRSGRLPRFL